MAAETLQILGVLASAIMAVALLALAVYRTRSVLMVRLQQAEKAINDLDKEKATREELEHLTKDVDRLVASQTGLSSEVRDLVMSIARGDFRPKHTN